MIPAAFTTVVNPPNRSRAAATIRAGASAAVTSAASTALRPPSRSTAAATSASPGSLRPTTRTAAPSRANLNAVARPMPLDAPVTMTCCTLGMAGFVAQSRGSQVSGPQVVA